MSTRAAPVARRRLPEAVRREQILQAALEIATRDGLDAVTARAVAASTGLSSGSVFFHFSTADALRGALAHVAMDRVLADLPTVPTHAPRAALLAFVGDRLANLARPRDRRTVELLIELWVAGLHSHAMRSGVKSAIERYRAAFVPLAHAAIAAAPRRFDGVTAEALAGTAVGLIIGSAMQAIADPRGFDHAASLTALSALLVGTPSKR